MRKAVLHAPPVERAGDELLSGNGPGSDVGRQHLRSFRLIIIIFVLLLGIGLTASWAAIEIVNITRAYATGEGRYSKAQKIAVLNLHRYAHSQQPEDYADFLGAIAVPLGDRRARVALQTAPVDMLIAAEGFLAGQNHPEDIAGVIWLFRTMSWWRPFAAAIADWTEGDRLVAELIEKGAALHGRIATGVLGSEERSSLLAAIDRTDDQLTALENTFSSHMGEAARAARTLVVMGLGGTIVLLWTVGIGFAVRLFRRQLVLDRQLGSSEQRFRDFAEIASDGYWEADARGRIIYVSDRFLLATGTSPGNLVNRHGIDVINEHATPGEAREHLEAIAERRAFRGLRLHYSKPDGSFSFWALAGKPRADAEGRFLGYRGVITDVTTAVRDAQVLREAKDRAEVANHAKSEFLANMSHELRTPLNAILGFSDVISRRLFGANAIDRYAAYASDIKESGEHLLAIINDILDLSKIEAHQAELSESEIGIEQICRATRTFFGDRFEEAGLEFAMSLPQPAPRLLADQRKLKQCLTNLLSNALKFTPRGGRITLMVGSTAEGGLSIAVADTGIGIAPGDIRTVLAPFGQVESALSRVHHGTGLGLPLAKSLIELHGGTLSLRSDLDVGTMVTLLLPPERVLVPTAGIALEPGSAAAS